jgi:hypothetical protein
LRHDGRDRLEVNGRQRFSYNRYLNSAWSRTGVTDEQPTSYFRIGGMAIGRGESRALKSHCLRIGDSQAEGAACFIKLAIVALIAAVRARCSLSWLATAATHSRSVMPSIRPTCRRWVNSTPAWKGARRNSKTRTTTASLPGTPGSSPAPRLRRGMLGGWSG